MAVDDQRIRSELSRLKELAYLRELEHGISKLDAAFGHWRDGSQTAFELDKVIHRYHQDTSRVLWEKYVATGLDELMVARAVAEGVLQADELSAQLHKMIGKKIDLFR